jgi:deoxyribodipyrimidine photo-lyase
MRVPDSIQQEKGVNIFWFRRDLRLEDNHALFEALQSESKLVPIFIFDSTILDQLEDRDDARVTFIHQELSSIDKQLRKLGSSLHTFYGDPLEVHTELLHHWPVKDLFANRDYEPYAQERDKKIFELYQNAGKKYHGFKDHVIFEKSEVVKADGNPYTVFTPYMKKWKQTLEDRPIENWPSEKSVNSWLKQSDGHIISLSEMGFQESSLSFPDREVENQILRDYGDKRDIPSIKGTSRLSLHLRFGTVSIRELVKLGKAQNEKWLNELIWRDFYQMIIYHFPHSVENSFKPAYDRIEWENKEEHFIAWCKGKTGYPIVDAGMRELNETGFMHNRVRMVTASFLTKHLLIDWRWGERYFARKLLDFELASNVGGWQWAASSGCDAAPYFRVFNPHLQFSKFDPQKKYVKKWIPELETEYYPKEIVEHKWARQRVLDRFEEALKS